MYNLIIAYSDGKVHKTKHETKEEASWYLHNEGDHVVAYKLEYDFGWSNPRQWTFEELVNTWIKHGGKL